MTFEAVVSEELPKRGLIVLRGTTFGEDVEQVAIRKLIEATGLPVLLLERDADITVVDLDEMRQLGWMPVPKEMMEE